MILSLIPQIRANHKKIAWLLLAMILTHYGSSLIRELNNPEPYEDYTMYLVPFYERCSLDRFEHFQLEYTGESKPYRNFLKSWLNCFGHTILNNDRILPIISSIGVVYLVYLLGHSISKDRIVGLIASAYMTTTPLLTNFDSSPTYDQAWAAFFLLSMVLLFRLPKASPLVYPLAIFTKTYAISFIPLYLYTAYKTHGFNKWMVLGVAGLVVIGVSSILTLGVGTALGFHPERIEEAELRIFEILWPVLPILMLFFGLDVIFKGHYNQSRNLVLLWIMGIILTIPIVYLFSEQWMFGYRFVPFAAFLGIYIGITIPKLGDVFIQYKLKPKKSKTLIKTS